MKVIDATPRMLDEFVSSSLELVSSMDGVLVIAVATGGIPLAKQIHSLNPDFKYAEVKCQRPTTATKKSGFLGYVFNKLLAVLPKCILNVLRLIEHFILQRRRNPSREIIELTKVSFENISVILIVDDAIDSGHSIKHVKKYFQNLVNIPVYTTVFVTTQRNPVAHADFSFLKNVLVRFPWSKDA
ncbi:hypothetical protein [Pseudoalteromonas piscicida]|uniref:hypothetical protein n=1 Tax=Pseudoalteromonas piscicida TaxID=43662 RepID=UPI0027E4DDE4|nr:hypothetical protein [Pseudoalteromonas piscicida]WMO14774.1 hypothetical protein NI376_03885 [Pseudoalteromonas piscicida]